MEETKTIITKIKNKWTKFTYNAKNNLIQYETSDEHIAKFAYNKKNELISTVIIKK
jgi:hypothetical protein